jgi:hypothetical protein
MLKGASYYVVVEGQDSYRAVFAWAELGFDLYGQIPLRGDQVGTASSSRATTVHLSWSCRQITPRGHPDVLDSRKVH